MATYNSRNMEAPSGVSRELSPFKVMVPVGGLNKLTSPIFLKDEESPDILNMRIFKDRAEKRTGYKEFGGNLPLPTGDVVLIDQFYKMDGNQWLIAATLTKLYKYNTSTKDWDDISGDVTFTGDEDNLFSCDIMTDKYILSNLIDPIKKWDGDGNIAALGGDPPKAKVVRAFKNRLLLMYTVESGNSCPQRVRWSAPGDPEDWPTGNFVDLVSGVDWIVGAEVLGNYLVIYKERSIVMVDYLGSIVTFSFDDRVTGIGCPAARTIQSLGNKHIFLGWDNVYIFNGVTIVAIADEVAKEIINSINPKYIDRCWAMIMEESDEYWLFIPAEGSETCNAAWVFNYLEDTWTYIDIAASVGGYFSRENSPTIDELVGTIDEQLWRYDDRMVLEMAPTNLFGDTAGNIFEYDYTQSKDNGETIKSYLITKDIVYGNIGVNARVLELEFSAKGTSVNLSYSIDGGRTWSEVKEFTLQPYFDDYKYYIDVVCRKIRFKFTNNEEAGSFSLQWYLPHYLEEVEKIVGADDEL